MVTSSGKTKHAERRLIQPAALWETLLLGHLDSSGGTATLTSNHDPNYEKPHPLKVSSSVFTFLKELDFQVHVNLQQKGLCRAMHISRMLNVLILESSEGNPLRSGKQRGKQLPPLRRRHCCSMPSRKGGRLEFLRFLIVTVV